MRNKQKSLSPKVNAILAQYLLVFMNLKGCSTRAGSCRSLDQKCMKVTNALAYRIEVHIIQSNFNNNGQRTELYNILRRVLISSRGKLVYLSLSFTSTLL